MKITWVENVSELPSYRYQLPVKRGMSREQVEQLAAQVERPVYAFERSGGWAILAVYA